MPAEMNALAERLARDTTIDPGKTLFVAYQPAPVLRTAGLHELGTYRAGSRASSILFASREPSPTGRLTIW